MIDRGRGVVETEVRAGSYGPVYFIIMSLLTTRNLTQEMSHVRVVGIGCSHANRLRLSTLTLKVPQA